MNGKSIAIKQERSDCATNLATYINPSRISAVDIQRGVIVMLMAFCHCREFGGLDDYSNMDWNVSPIWLGTSYLDLIQQAFMSMVVAGGFFMLMGVGIIFFYQSRLKDNWPLEKICKYLLLRGLLLIFIQLTLLQFFEIIAGNKIFFYAGVLMSLGFCMIAASLCVYFSYKIKQSYLIPISVILVICIAMQFMINHVEVNHVQPSIWDILFFFSGHHKVNGFDLDINFTPLPWFPAVAFGLMIGQLLVVKREKAFSMIGLCGLSFLIAWFCLRMSYLNGWTTFGEYKQTLANDSITWASYLCMSKFPPSISFFLWSLGINLTFIFLFYQAEMFIPRFIQFLTPIKTFGQCALIFFIVHWFVYYGWGLIIHKPFTTPLGIGFFWVLGLMTLYPLCLTFNRFKLKQAKESLWRMF